MYRILDITSAEHTLSLVWKLATLLTCLSAAILLLRLLTRMMVPQNLIS